MAGTCLKCSSRLGSSDIYRGGCGAPAEMATPPAVTGGPLRTWVLAGYISCFPHGLDLYAGWEFWVYMPRLRMLFLVIGERVQDWAGLGGPGTRGSLT
jgi:hypothetical protein